MKENLAHITYWNFSVMYLISNFVKILKLKFAVGLNEWRVEWIMIECSGNLIHCIAENLVL